MTGDLWLPPGAVTFDPDVERVIDESADPVAARAIAEQLRGQGVTFSTEDGFAAAVTGPDSALILLPRDWGRMALADGRDVLCAFVESKPLERMLMDSTLEPENFGVIETAEHPLVQASCPALWMKLKQFQTFTPLEWPQMPCPIDWRAEAPNGFAIAVPHPDPTETRQLYVASPPLRDGHGIVIAPSHEKTGRNDRCPCGSGIKFKRCCGA